MNDEKLVKYIGIFFGGIVVILTTALAIAVLPTWYEGLFWGLGICALFSGIIFMGLRQHRVRKIIPKTLISPNHQSESTLEIPIKQSAYKLDTSLSKLILISAVVVIILNFLFFSQGEFNPKIINFMIRLSVGLFLAIILIGRVASAPYRKAGELLRKNPLPRKFVLNQNGLSIPIEIITNNSFQVALKQNKTDIFIPWEDLESWEVYAGSGRSSDQHVLKLQGKSRGLAGLIMPTMGIIRSEELRKMDYEIINFASRFLQKQISICTNDLGKEKG